MLTLYTLPSIAALALKSTIFWYGRHSFSSASIWLWLFFIGLFCMNIIELMGFYYVTKPEKGLIFLSIYYISAEIAFTSLFALSLDNVKKLSSTAKTGIIFFLIISILPLLIPGAALAGAKSIGYSVTRIPGPFYFIVQIGILAPLVSGLIVSSYFSYHAKSYSSKRRSRILVISCIPIFISVIIVMLLMHLGFQINASVILSLMITFTLMMLVYTEHKEHQYKFMSFIPNTRENIFVKRLAHLITDPQTSLEQGRSLVEQEMIREALILSRGNKIKAAATLGISRQTLQRKLEKSNLDRIT